MRGRFLSLFGLGLAVALAASLGAATVTTGTIGIAKAAGEAGDEHLRPIERLGKAIFLDQRLSINQNQSCYDCHDPEAGWTGESSEINAAGAVYEGSIAGRFGERKPPSAAYATQAPILHRQRDGTFVGGNFWDGRATGEELGNPAADQAQGPFLNPVEQALPDQACVVYRVVNAPDYPVAFQAVWGNAIDAVSWPENIETVCATVGARVWLSEEDRALVEEAFDQIALSIAAYEASPEVNAFTSKFDAWLLGRAQLTRQERWGLALFRGKGKCVKCHVMSGPQPLFTDFTYDNLGIPKNPQNPVYERDPGFVDLGLGGFLATRPEWAAYADENMGAFKVPTLRNVALVPEPGFVKAYGHNGYFKSLEAVVHFYNTRDVLPTCDPVAHPEWVEGVDCWPAPEYPENVNTRELGDLNLSPRQEAAIVAFLRTLSDGYFTR